VITITLVGDTGFGGTMERISSKGGKRHGRTIPFERMIRRVRPLIDGDVRFSNIETVITDQPGLRSLGKAFNFRMHSAGFDVLRSDLGFNLFSLANNHAVDFGRAGMADTLRILREESPGILGHSGLGESWKTALRPATFSVKSVRMAFAAIGIGANSRPSMHPRDGRVGQLPYNDRTVRDIVAGLDQTDADYRILSVHAGLERRITPTPADIARMRDLAVRDGKVNLVVGHHAHVVQGIQKIGDDVIFYGLGNFLHPGMQDMGKFDRCRDYGLIGKVHLVVKPDGGTMLGAIEAIPILDMHMSPRPLNRRAAARRIGVLNGLARRLNSRRHGAEGVMFSLKPNGNGLHCTVAGRRLPGKIGDLCRKWLPPRSSAPVARGRKDGQSIVPVALRPDVTQRSRQQASVKSETPVLGCRSLPARSARRDQNSAPRRRGRRPETSRRIVRRSRRRSGSRRTRSTTSIARQDRAAWMRSAFGQ
ncbi:MAG: CapA family protein, partial [Pseudomonadota bacterium]